MLVINLSLQRILCASSYSISSAIKLSVSSSTALVHSRWMLEAMVEHVMASRRLSRKRCSFLGNQFLISLRPAFKHPVLLLHHMMIQCKSGIFLTLQRRPSTIPTPGFYRGRRGFSLGLCSSTRVHYSSTLNEIILLLNRK